MIFTFFKLAWPFLKEFFLGKNSIMQAYRQGQWLRLMMLGLFVGSIVTNVWMGRNFLAAVSKIYRLEHQMTELKDKPAEPPVEASAPAVQATPEPEPAPPTRQQEPQPTLSQSASSTGNEEYLKRLSRLQARYKAIENQK